MIFASLLVICIQIIANKILILTIFLAFLLIANSLQLLFF